MTPEHAQAFYDASGIHAAGLAWDLRLFVGGVALVCALLILIGLISAIGTSDSPLEKVIFIVSLLVLSMVLMLIFSYIA